MSEPRKNDDLPLWAKFALAVFFGAICAIVAISESGKWLSK
jgi:hypothetical protein